MLFLGRPYSGVSTETEEMFNNTLRIIDESDLSFLHVFPYSWILQQVVCPKLLRM